jgi:hypothetical protein
MLIHNNKKKKLELGLQKGGRLLIANDHYDWRPIGYREKQSDNIFKTHLWKVCKVLGFVMLFTNIIELCKNARPKPFC